MANTPSITDDIYSDEVLSDPYPTFQRMRGLGSAVWMERHGVYALTRHQACRTALRDWRSYTSTSGVMMNDHVNGLVGGKNLLCMNGADHSRVRSVLAAPLTHGRVAEIRSTLEDEASQLVDRLVAQGTFDACDEMTTHLPMTIVLSLVGINDEGRRRLPEWAKASFNAMGPVNERTQAALPKLAELHAFVTERCTRADLTPGSWADQLWDAAADGRLRPDEPMNVMTGYLAPSLDTTINATATMVERFARHPEQWTLLRENPDLAGNAVEEVLRIDAPVQGFSRLTIQDVEVDGTPLPAGTRVLVLYASANRDERHFEYPDVFDITRPNASDHLSLGHGSHACPGGHLARAELRALIAALIPTVKRFDLLETDRELNNMTRGLSRCVVRVEPA